MPPLKVAGPCRSGRAASEGATIGRRRDGHLSNTATSATRHGGGAEGGGAEAGRREGGGAEGGGAEAGGTEGGGTASRGRRAGYLECFGAEGGESAVAVGERLPEPLHLFRSRTIMIATGLAIMMASPITGAYSNRCAHSQAAYRNHSSSTHKPRCIHTEARSIHATATVHPYRGPTDVRQSSSRPQLLNPKP